MIGFDKDGDLWTITLDRSEKANSLTSEMLTEMLARVHEASAAKCLVITGKGKVFSAGADLDEARAGLATSPLWEQLSGAIAGLECLTITAMNGTLAGGACGMALASDLRISVPTAKVFYPVMRLGFLPQPSDVKRLVRLVGPSSAKLILMGGLKVGADEGLAMGLIDRLTEDLNGAVQEIAEAALGAKQTHIAAIKAMVNAA